MRLDAVEVTWLDPHASGGWRAPDDELDRAVPLTCTSVGYLLRQDEERLVLVQSSADDQGDELVADSLAIPAAVIRKVRRLR